MLTNPAHPSRPEQLLRELVARRRVELEEQAGRLETSALDLERREEQLRDARLAFERTLRVALQELEGRETELAARERELEEREGRLRRGEEELALRRQELGAVELKRAALEQRERALAAREEALAKEERRRVEAEAAVSTVSLLFAPGPRYRLLECDPPRALAPGQAVTVDGEELLVARLGPSPLPRDKRRCAYLVLGPRRGEPGGGSA